MGKYQRKKREEEEEAPQFHRGSSLQALVSAATTPFLEVSK